MRSATIAVALSVAWATPAVADEAPLGRLFFSPDERRALDERRTELLAGSGRRLRLDGIVRTPRRTTLWIDGAAREAGGDAGALPVARHPGKVAVATGVGPATVGVGESVDLDSGRRDDRLRGGALVVRGRPR